MAERDSGTEQGGTGDAPDTEEDLQRALERKVEDLTGDIEQNRNLSGSTTYETLHEEEGNAPQ